MDTGNKNSFSLPFGFHKNPSPDENHLWDQGQTMRSSSPSFEKTFGWIFGDASSKEQRAEEQLEISKNALKVLERRYLRKGPDGKPIENPKEMFARVAMAIAQADALFDQKADVETTAREFYRLMTSLEFMPNSPTLMNAGRELGQLSACFVLPVNDSMESIFEAVKHTAIIHKSGGGTGFSFSRIRPKNDVVQSTKGVSSGPVSFMRVFDMATETIKQGGTRRGANMGILRVDHPDILDFIGCKSSQESLNNFNISVGITDAFMAALEKGSSYELINPHGQKVVKKLDAQKVFKAIVNMAWRNGEPGIIFLDRLNQDNPTPHIGTIESTNPCGEQPLLPYESCNLGSINLSKMVVDGQLDWTKLQKCVHTAVHFLDNVIEVNRYPLPEIEKTTKGNRKIGLGVMGYADMLISLGLAYDSEQALELAAKVMQFIQTESRSKSADLAKQRGPFPNFEGSTYDHQGFAPLRNATTTTIAPTGTISIISGCSSGIEPLFGICFVRNVMDNDELVEVNPLFASMTQQESFYSKEFLADIAKQGSLKDFQEIPEHYRSIFVTAHDISSEWHVKTQAAFQKYTDNAVSKTVNLHKDASEADVERIYQLAYNSGCKGVTVYRDGSRDEQVLNIGKVNKKTQATHPEASIQSMEKLVPRERPEIIQGSTQKMSTGCGNLYVTINEDDQGIFELFTAMGKAGGCAASQAEAISRLISLALRAGVDAEAIVRQLSGVRCPSPAWKNGELVLSCADAISRALKRYRKNLLTTQTSDVKQLQSQEGLHTITLSSDAMSDSGLQTSSALSAASSSFIACPDCGGSIEHAEGCLLCRECGYSKCS